MDRVSDMTPEIAALIERDRRELSGSFCRGCGYCMPCPVGIQINNCARMSLMLRRAPSRAWLTPEWQANMAKMITTLDYLGIPHSSTLVYTLGRETELPKCAILMEKMGNMLVINSYHFNFNH